MQVYQIMYVTLFRAVTLALRMLEDRKNTQQVIALLKYAQQECERLYIEAPESTFD